MINFGAVPSGAVLPIIFGTYGSNGESITLTGLAVTDIEIYKGTSVTQRASDAGYALIDTDGIDIDTITGIHGFSIDTGDNTDAGFYTVGSFFTVVVSAVTINSQTVNFVAATFRIVAAEGSSGTPKADVSHIAGSTVSTTSAQLGVNVVNAGGTAWASGSLTSGVFATGAITATAIAADAIGASELAADAVAEIADAVWDEDATAHQTGGTFGQAIGDPGADTNTIFKAVVTDATGATVGVDVAAVLADTGTDGVVVASINANAITATAIAADAITAAKIATGAIDADAIADNAIDAGAIAADAITAAKIADGAIDAGTFAAGAITASAIAADAIGASELAADAVAEIADAVWDEASSGHVTAGTFGQTLYSFRSNTAQAGAATTITLDASASAVNDFYNNTLIVITAGTGVGQARFITGYDGTTKVATVDTWATNPGADSVFVIIPFGAIPGASAPTAAQVADAVWDEATAGHTTAGTFGEQLKTDVDAILVDTAEIGAAGAGLSAVPWNAAWDAEVQSEVTDGLNAYDPPTKAETDALLTTALTESYAANGAAPTLTQAMMAVHQMLMQFAISGTTYTVKKLDNSTTAFVVTLDDASTPTSAVRT